MRTMLTVIALWSVAAGAQVTVVQPAGAAPDVLSAGYFFFAVLAGLALAVALQLALTYLSLAFGLSAVQVEPSDGGSETGSSSMHGMFRKTMAGLGFWATVTSAVSGFVAAWLVVFAIPVASVTVGGILGLVIWSLFFFVLVSVDMRILSSLTGTVSRLAGEGVKTLTGTIGSIFSRSDEAKAVDEAREVAKVIKHEILGDPKVTQIRHDLHDYFKQLEPSKHTPHAYAKEIRKLLNDVELRAVTSEESPLYDEEETVTRLTAAGVPAEKAKRLAETTGKALGQLSQTVKEELGDQAPSGGDVRNKIEDYLRATNKEELDPDHIRNDLKRLLTEPKAATQSLKQRLNSLDEEAVVAVLAERQDMTQEEAEQAVQEIREVVTEWQTKAGEQLSGALETAQEKIHGFVDKLRMQPDQYTGLEHDIALLFHDPEAGMDMLIARLKQLDREDIKHMLASREDISEEDAERIIGRVEQVRDEVVEKAQQVQHEIERRAEAAKRTALEQVDETRRDAALAAWWGCVAAGVSALATAGGGVLAAAVRVWVG